MTKAQNGNTVKVHYIGTLENGTQFDSSIGGEPLEFKIGEGMLLPMFENAVVGLQPGETVNVKIPAADGYGLRNEGLVINIERAKLPPTITPETGMKLQMQTKEGQPLLLTITDVQNDFIKVDANHELAGKDLNFKIDLVEILPS
jgi:peptidylprolyl isomerase